MSSAIRLRSVSQGIRLKAVSGLAGPKGDKGDTGETPDFEIGTVTTESPGDPATASITGTAENPVLNLGLPEGEKGDAATIAIGTVTTVASTDPATVTNVGTSDAAIFDFEIPQGAAGSLDVNTLSHVTPASDDKIVLGDTSDSNNTKYSTAAEVFTAGKSAASTSATGVVELATDAEAQAKADTARAITPSNLAALGSSETFAGLVELATDAETQTGTDTARAITPANLTAAARKQGKETIWIPAAAMIARTTNGAASGTAETSTNKNMIRTLDFDTTTQEFAQFSIAMPKSWNNGTVTFQPVWSHASTTTNFGVVWALQAVARSDDDAIDVAFGTEQTSTDTGGTTNDLYIGPESSAITISGTPATGDVVQFQIKRNPSDGSDTMAIDARLHGVKVYFTTNAATDA